MLSTLNEIKLGQKTQEQVNIKLDKTLDAIQKEREIDEKNKKENDKNIRDMKNVGAWFSWDNIWIANYSIIAYAYGHIREVNKMFKLIFGYSFWTCFWFGKCK